MTGENFWLDEFKRDHHVSGHSSQCIAPNVTHFHVRLYDWTDEWLTFSAMTGRNFNPCPVSRISHSKKWSYQVS